MSSRLLLFFIIQTFIYSFVMEASAEYLTHCEDESYSFQFTLEAKANDKVVGKMWSEDKVEHFKSYKLHKESRTSKSCEFSAEGITGDGSQVKMVIDKDNGSETGFTGYLQDNLIVDAKDKQFSCYVSKFAYEQVCGKPLHQRGLSSKITIQQAKK